MLGSYLQLSAQATNQAEAEIRTVLEKQVAAWNRGDKEAFMLGYWQNDSLRFVGKSGVTQGWQATLERYQKNYPDKAAMGTLRFDLLSVDLLGADAAYVLGRFTLVRGAADKPETQSGMFSLVFRRKQGRWKIVLDHTS